MTEVRTDFKHLSNGIPLFSLQVFVMLSSHEKDSLTSAPAGLQRENYPVKRFKVNSYQRF